MYILLIKIHVQRVHQLSTYLCLRIRRLFVTGPLHLLSIHAHTKLRPTPQKKLVVVGSRIGSLGNAPKSIEIELTLERRQLGLSEILK